MFFTTRVSGFNVRWGQALLLLAALPALFRLLSGLQNRSAQAQTRLKFLIHWTPFFLIYGAAALCSATPFLTGLKWGWGLFNIGLAALVCLYSREDESLERGFQWAVIAITALVWLEALALYVFPSWTVVRDLGPGMPASVSLFSIPIGFAQVSLCVLDFQTYRPNAFYYEPSYAGCALTFAFFLLYDFDSKRPKARSGWLPALAASSIVLTSSRAGMLSALIFWVIAAMALFRRPGGFPIQRSLLKSVVLGAVLIGLFCLAPLGLKYLQFISGPLGADTPARLHQQGTSEGNRLLNMQDCLKLWRQHPLLGNGVLPQSEGGNKGLSQFSMETWLEVGLESGALGVLVFLFAILANMRLAWINSRDWNLKALVMAAWAVHFTVQFLLSQTFPRLDYWLLFFLSVRLLLKQPGETAAPPRKIQA